MVFVAQKVERFYETESPGFPVDVNVSSSIEGLPAGVGSIWQHVGPASGADKRSLLERFGSTPQELPIGIEGVLVIVNKNNPVMDLSIDQLRAIFTGKITNWREVGGPNRRIQLYSTESLVGGSMFFQDFVLHGDDIDTTMRGYSNAKETAIAVASDLGGIGLTPAAGENSVKYPRIGRSANAPGIDGTTENVRNLSYPLSSYLYWSFGRKYSPAVEHFIEFALSGRGQMAIEASGCYPLNANQRVRSQVALAKK
jgi:phosphate transport system substrate-binding protein